MFLSHEQVLACMQGGRIGIASLDEKHFKQGSYSFTLGERISCLKAGGEIIVGQAAEYEEGVLSDRGYVLVVRPGYTRHTSQGHGMIYAYG